jgi:hypothetical protein
MTITVGKRTRWNMGEVKTLRAAAEIPGVNLARINTIVRRCDGDFDLALTALTMKPRPDWVEHFLTADVTEENGF